MRTRTRRSFLTESLRMTSGVLAGSTGICSLAARTTSSTIKARPDVIIYEGSYPGWPWITAGPAGVLYCAWREGTVHDYSPSGKALFASSSDQGKTWSQAQVIVDVPEIDDRNVAIVELPNKELLVTYNSYDAAKASLALSVRSSDRGRTWST